MRRVFSAVVFTGAVLAAAAAAAQTPAARPATQAPATQAVSQVDEPFASIFGGGAAVQNVGGAASAEFGVHLKETIDVFAEGTWMQNVATRRKLDLAALVATNLQALQGGTVTGTVVAPAGYIGAGVRIFFLTSKSLRPYFVVGGGVARLALKPTFILGGADVTANLAQYGFTIGSDLTGEVTKPAFSGGLGVQVPFGSWFVDGGFRVTSIKTADQPTTVLRGGAALGFTF